VTSGEIRVLVADDSVEVRGLLRAVLDQDGRFTVVGEAADGEGAVTMAREERPDMVVLDLAMPVKGGLAAIDGIRRAAPATQILVVSAYATPTNAERARQRGAARCLQKAGVGWALGVPAALAALRSA